MIFDGKENTMGRITVITSGKGGVGKSTVSACLGAAFASRGQRVLLVDGDAGLRSLDLMTGIGDRVVFHLGDVFEGRCEPIKAIYQSPYSPSLYIIPASVSLDQLCTPHDMLRLCHGFSRYFDQVLIDCPAGIGPGFQAAVSGAEAALVLSTPDLICARDAAIIGQLLQKRQIRARLVINRLRPALIRKGLLPDVDEIIDIAGIRLLGIVPEDDKLTVAASAGQQIPDDIPAVRCIQRIAGRILGENLPLTRL